jgi:hypothetical protein
MISYFGHWTFELPHVRFDDPPEHAHTHGHTAQPVADVPDESNGAHDHSQHCHGESASCSDVPFSGSATVVALAERLAGLGSGSAFWAMPLSAIELWRGHAPGVELQPPKL